MHFASDNAAGIAPAILEAIGRANDGFALGYGEDAITKRLERRLAEIFEHELAAFLVPTGTAANALALAQIAPPWGAVLCHEECHLATDECGAPEFFGGGLKLIALAGEACKIPAATLEAALKRLPWGGPHHVTAAALSLTQATEAGTLYAPDEHVDGARFANALVRQNLAPAAASWKLGVDVLSFGATKGGALAAEAVLFFDPARAAGLPERRKRGGHLLSKHRFLAAQLEAYLTDDLWLTLARHANAMADLLAGRLAAAGYLAVWPVEANEVFVKFSHDLDRRLRQAGAGYHPWATGSLPASVALGPDEVLVHLVTSFATRAEDVEEFVDVIRRG